MKRIEYNRYGGPEQMQLVDFEPTEPRPGRVLVRVVAAAANPMDWKMRRGEMKLVTGRRFPRGVGHDFAGTVERVGKGVTEFKPGDAVFGAVGMNAGAFAEVVMAEGKFLAKKPETVSFESASALPIVGVTALQALNVADIHSGTSVFINGVLGGVGRATAQLAVARGATVSGGCRDPESSEATAIDLSSVVGFDFDPALLSGKFDLVFDTAGTLPSAIAARMLKPGGRAVFITPTPALFLRSLVSRKLTVLITKINAADLNTLGRAAADGTLTMAIARTAPLSEGIAALTELEISKQPKNGKLIITPQQ